MIAKDFTIGGDEWQRECLRWRGRVLVGERRHWCYDWDFLPVDETTPGIDGCSCFPSRNHGQGSENT
jgi:hypothetical protein